MEVIVDLLCWRCGRKIDKTIRRRGNMPVVGRKLCFNCQAASLALLVRRNKSKKFRDFNSKRMKKNNPMYDSSIVSRCIKTKREDFRSGKTISTFCYPEKLKKILALIPPLSKKNKKLFSERMKKNNPMFNPKTVEKVKKTQKKLRQEGKIVFKNGPEHHLWRGNRDFNNSCRCRLYTLWVLKVMERDWFRCTKCGTKNKIQVHHIKPLRQFIKLIMKKYCITSFSKIDSSKWQPFIDEIVSLHKLSDGITVCEKCHEVIDPYYRNKKLKS